MVNRFDAAKQLDTLIEKNPNYKDEPMPGDKPKKSEKIKHGKK
jgi:hypothetical protein|tara:strand:- start:1311 stop:1439 length:129 start_codon:yes stop_codon:yes gene_type:complete